MTKKRLPTSRRATVLFLLALAASLSLALFGLLSLQMAEGQDPVLMSQEKRPVVYKKIKVTKKVVLPRKTVYVQDQAPATSAVSPYTSSPTYVPSTSYSTTTTAPAPAPAPVVSTPS